MAASANTKLTREASRRRPGVYGILSPGALLTVEGVMHSTGLGEESLAAARQSGVVKAVHLGRRVFYRSDELIEWILSQSKNERASHGHDEISD